MYLQVLCLLYIVDHLIASRLAEGVSIPQFYFFPSFPYYSRETSIQRTDLNPVEDSIMHILGT